MKKLSDNCRRTQNKSIQNPLLDENKTVVKETSPPKSCNLSVHCTVEPDIPPRKRNFYFCVKTAIALPNIKVISVRVKSLLKKSRFL